LGHAGEKRRGAIPLQKGKKGQDRGVGQSDPLLTNGERHDLGPLIPEENYGKSTGPSNAKKSFAKGEVVGGVRGGKTRLFLAQILRKRKKGRRKGLCGRAGRRVLGWVSRKKKRSATSRGGGGCVPK